MSGKDIKVKPRSSIRILEVVQSLEKGGRTVRFHDTVTALSQLGHFVIAVCFGPFDKPTAAKHDLCLPRSKGKQLSLIWRLIKVIRQHNIDIVHAHCESTQLYAGLAAKICGIPCVGTFHRSRLECYQPSVTNRLIRFALSHFVAVSKDRMQLLTSHLGLPEQKCSVVYGGTSFLAIAPRTSEVARMQLQIDAQYKVLLSIGHLGKIKGHQDTLRALAMLNRNDVKLYIAGTGTEQEQHKLQELCNTLQLQQQVSFVGHINDAALWLDACDIFIQPSHEEAFGLVFIEAGARRRPVVATNVGGIKEIIQHGTTGMLVPTASPDQLASTLAQLIADKETCQQLGQAGFNRVKQTFSISAMIDGYLRIFNHLLRKEGPSYDAS
jgi:glycosyltransferase involved in cell wall biosynthesis